jgi:hypothetical protein
MRNISEDFMMFFGVAFPSSCLVQPGATPVTLHGNYGLPGRFDPHI